jgi:(heptosyl)LPS beta-1,4-glucosyltransferase
VKTKEEFAAKMLKYGTLTAEKYAEMGKRSSWLRVRISPVFSFVKNYFFKLGFLDGEAGLICARMNSYYTRVKYARLLELNRQNE